MKLMCLILAVATAVATAAEETNADTLARETAHISAEQWFQFARVYEVGNLGGDVTEALAGHGKAGQAVGTDDDGSSDALQDKLDDLGVEDDGKVRRRSLSTAPTNNEQPSPNNEQRRPRQ